MLVVNRVGQRIVAGLAALAVVLGLTATAVALAPAASATSGVTRIQVSSLNSNIDVSSPNPATTYRNYTDARNSTVPMTVTFGGSATFTVDGGTPTSLTSGVPVDVPVHTGVTAIAITDESQTYNVEIKRAWLISGFAIYNGATDELIFSRKVSDGNFDPLSRAEFNVSLPHSVGSIKWRMWYDTPTEATATERSAWIGGGVACSGYECQSGELSEAQKLPIGNWMNQVITQVDSGTGFDYYTWTEWRVNFTRAPAYSSAALTSLTSPLAFTYINGSPFTYRALANADTSTVPLTANFSQGTAAYTVNGGSSTPMTTGVAASIPIATGLTTVQITHTAANSTQTVYTYRIVRPHPITGFEIEDYATGDILMSKTGADFDVTNHQLYLTIPNSVSQIRIRSYFDPWPDGVNWAAWIHSYGYCPGQCESGEWSNPLTMNVGVQNGGPLMMVDIPGVTEYGDWSYWMIQITRASAATEIGSVSVSGTVQAGNRLTATANGVGGYPTPTVTYQWQSASTESGPWTDIAGETGRRLQLTRTDSGSYVRVVATAANGISAPTSLASVATAAVTNVVPTAPTGVRAVPGDGTVDVSWVPPIDGDYNSATVTATGGGSTFHCTDTDYDCTLTGLTNGVEYTISVIVTASTGAGAIDSAPSTQITATPATPTAPDITGASITGTSRAGEFLTAVASGATGTPGPTLSYVWQQSDDGVDGWSNIADATRSALFLTSARVGKYIRVRITARTGVAPAATAVSDAVGPVSASWFQPWDNEVHVTNPGGYPTDVAYDSLGYMYVVTAYSSHDGIAKYAPGATGEDPPVAVWDLTEERTRIVGSRLAIDSNDNVFVTDSNNNRVWELPAGSRASDPLRLRLDETSVSYPTSIAVDANGYIYVGEPWNHRIQVFAPGSPQSASPVRTITYAGSVADFAIDPDGNLAVASGSTVDFYAPGAAGSSTPVRTMNSISNCTYYGVAFDGEGRMWVTSDGCQKVYVFNRNAVSTVAPVLILDVGSSYAMGANPATGNVSAATLWSGVVRTWDRHLLDFPPLPMEGAPALATVTTTITGELAVRGDLAAAYAGLTGLPAPSLTAQWQKADSESGPWTDISGETARTLALGRSLEGKYVRIAVTVANVHGESTTTSTPLGPIGPRPARGLVREIRGANMGVDTITDLEYLPGGRIAASNQWNSMNRISVFGPTADGNAAPAQQIEMNFNGYRSGWGLSLAPGGDVWAAYHGGWVARVHNTDDGLVEPQQLITSAVANGLSGARSVVQDANGYIYVGVHDQSLVKIFAPGATGASEPIRTLSLVNRGLLIDVEGNLIVGSNGFLRYFEPGASTNNEPIKSVPISGTAWDLGTDSQHRIWVLSNNFQFVVFNPLLESSSTPVLSLTDDWATKFGGMYALAVDPESSGVFALSDGTGIKTYDWSSLLPAVPGEAAPTISNVGLTGEVRVAGDVQATVGAFSGYPDAALTYQWQRADSRSGTWSDIAGATGAHYYPVTSDAAKYLRVKVTATNRLGSASEVSEASSQLGYGYVRSPISVLRGAGTRISNPWVVRHLVSGKVIVGDHQGRFQVFAEDATQNAAPLQSFYVPGETNPSGVTQAADGSLWLAFESGPSRLVRVPVDAQGAVVPLQEITTTCGRPGSGVVDEQGRLYVPCSYDNAIKVFAADATGNATPVREITGQNYVRAVAIDPSGNLAVPGTNFYRTFLMGGAGTSNTPIVDKSLNFSARDVAWDGGGNILFSESGGVHAYTADLADPNTPVAQFTNDGWSFTSDIYGMYFDVQTDQLRVASYNTGIITLDWAAILEGDPDIPTPATNLRTTVGVHSFTLQWDPTPGEVTNYVVTATGGSQPLVCTTTETSCTFDWFDGARGGTTYSVNVQTIRRTATATSDSVSVTPEEDPNSRPPAKVTGLTAEGLNGVITVSWTAPRGTVTGYTATATSGATTLTCEPEEATDTTCQITGAQNGSTYDVTVVAHRYDESGVASDAVSVTVVRREAPTVEALVLTGTAQSGRTLVVTDPVVTGFPEPTVTYQWQSAAANSGPWVEIPDQDALTLDLKRRDVSRYVRLVVVADNGVGDAIRRYSRIVGPVLSMAGTTESTAEPITGLRGEFGDGRVTLTWDRVKGITADSYTISYTAGGTTRTVIVASNLLAKTITGLTNGTTYRFSVIATGHDESKSKVIAVMPVGALGKVAKVSVTVRGSTVTLKWSRPAGTSPVSVYRVVLDSTAKGVPDREVTVKAGQAVVSNVAKGSYRITITPRNVVGAGAVYAHPGVVSVG